MAPFGTFEPPIRDGVRLNDSSARLDDNARLSGSCAGPAIEAHDSTVGESPGKTVTAAAAVPAHAVATAATRNRERLSPRLARRFEDKLWRGRLASRGVTSRIAVVRMARATVEPSTRGLVALGRSRQQR